MTHGAYVLAAPIHAPPVWIVMFCMPIIVIGAILVSTVGYELGLKESWI